MAIFVGRFRPEELVAGVGFARPEFTDVLFALEAGDLLLVFGLAVVTGFGLVSVVSGLAPRAETGGLSVFVAMLVVGLSGFGVGLALVVASGRDVTGLLVLDSSN